MSLNVPVPFADLHAQYLTLKAEMDAAIAEVMLVLEETKSLAPPPFHEFDQSVKGSLPSDLRWQAYLRINQLSTSFLRVLMMPPKTPPAIVDTMRQAILETFADPAYQADARQTFNNVPQFRSGDVQKQALLGVLGPRPGVQEFIAEYVAKGFRSVGDKK